MNFYYLQWRFSITWHLIPLKEPFDEKIIDSAFLKITESEVNDLKTHFIYAGLFYFSRGYEDTGQSLSSFVTVTNKLGD